VYGSKMVNINGIKGSEYNSLPFGWVQAPFTFSCQHAYSKSKIFNMLRTNAIKGALNRLTMILKDRKWQKSFIF